MSNRRICKRCKKLKMTVDGSGVCAPCRLKDALDKPKPVKR